MIRAIPMLSIAALLAAAPSHPVAAASPSAIAADREIWTMTIGFITTAAEQLPDSNYAYRPVATVRSFGELIGHLAGAQRMFCAAALGDKPSSEGDIEKTVTGKAALVAALKASTEYCQKAYAMTDAEAAKRTVKLFGTEQTALWTVLENTAHDSEHYGNIVTYLRMLGMVPPSSQPQPK